jgi:hypothetical protein
MQRMGKRTILTETRGPLNDTGLGEAGAKAFRKPGHNLDLGAYPTRNKLEWS